MSVYRIIIAGSTQHTRLIAESLRNSSLQIIGCLTPKPKPIGRKQIITPNPLHKWADQNQVPVVLIDQKIDRALEPEMHRQFRQPNQAEPLCDILLVVDFGYYVPGWLLKKARKAPLNIHPSLLPRWRGSSPGQFALLYGDNPSAISLITVAKQMDQGDIWIQKEFAVNPHWNAADYYQHAFTEMAQDLPTVVSTILTDTAVSTEQPASSPTPVARKISKADCYLPWSALRATQTGKDSDYEVAQLELENYLHTPEFSEPPLLAQILVKSPLLEWTRWIERAVRAFAPWPKVWTLAPSIRGQQRLQLHQAHIQGDTLQLDRVQLEGQQPASFQQIKTSLII